MSVSAEGRDYSAYQKPVEPIDLAGLSFAYTRVSDWFGNVMRTDPEFVHDWTEIEARGLHRGAYWYLVPGVSAVSQANYFVAAVKKAGLKPGDMLVCDSELWYAGVDSQTHTFCSEVVALAGPQCPVLVYTNQNVGEHLTSCTGWPLWFAHPGATTTTLAQFFPWKNWTFWQWGTVGGIDADAFNGSPAELDSWIASHYQPEEFDLATFTEAQLTSIVQKAVETVETRDVLASAVLWWLDKALSGEVPPGATQAQAALLGSINDSLIKLAGQALPPAPPVAAGS